MDYPGVDLASFARDAGFDDGRVAVDVRFLARIIQSSAWVQTIRSWASMTISNHTSLS